MDLENFVVRNPTFNFDGMERYWALNSPSITHLMNSLSIMTPAFERKVLSSSHIMLKNIKSNELKEKIKIYIKQEASHTNLHNIYNEKLLSYGYGISSLIHLSEVIINTIKIFPKFSAACVASGEHFSNFLGRFMLSLKDEKNFQHEPFSLFKWHVCEEIEHSEICFDISSAVGNGYIIRIFAHLYSTFIFFFLFWVFTINLLMQDRKFFKISTIKDISNFLVFKKYTYKSFIIEFYKSFWDYFKPSFHPSNYKDDRDYAAKYLKNEIAFRLQ